MEKEYNIYNICKPEEKAGMVSRNIVMKKQYTLF